MIHRRFKYEGWLYALALTIALAVRLTQLGAVPLADAEAAPALQALRISQGEDPALSPHPLYILSTSVFFLLYGGGTNFLARFFPALIGGLLVLAPLLFDGRLKPRPSLILAFFLALDPGLVAISRQAASPILAITFLAFTAGFLNRNKHQPAAVAAALALLSGPSVWLGLLGIGVVFAIYRIFIHPEQTPKENEGKAPQPSEHSTPPSTDQLPLTNYQPLSAALLPFLLAFFLAGTLFFTVPGGIGAAFSSIPAFFNSLSAPSEATREMILISLPAYQPLALTLTLMALARGWSRGLRRIVFLSVCLLVPLAIVLLIPARQMADAAWMLIPLNALASLELARHMDIYPDERRETAGVALLTAFILTFTWLGAAEVNFIPVNAPDFRIRIGVLSGSILLLIVSLILVAAGWSIRIARFGGVWGLAFGLGVLGLSGMFGSAGLRGMNAPELWHLPGVPLQAGLIRDTVSQVSELGRGNDHTAAITIVGFQSPALEWALRENPVQTAAAVDAVRPPEFIVAPYEMNPEWIAAYRGQDLNWRQTPAWEYADGPGWLRWLTLREMPQEKEVIILWARSDLFLDE